MPEIDEDFLKLFSDLITSIRTSAELVEKIAELLKMANPDIEA